MVRPHWERDRVRDAPRVNFRSDFGGVSEPASPRRSACTSSDSRLSSRRRRKVASVPKVYARESRLTNANPGNVRLK
jgi:hypothetical protein